MADVWKHPTSTITGHYHSLGLSPRRGTGCQRLLVRRGLILSCPITFGHSRIKILSLTELGKATLGIHEADADRLGGPEHRYWKKRLADHLRASGYDVTEEYPVGGGKTIDLVAARDGRRFAFEVETGKSDAAGNVQKCLDVGMDGAIVVATTASVRDVLVAKLRSVPNVEVTTASEVINRFAEGGRHGSSTLAADACGVRTLG